MTQDLLYEEKGPLGLITLNRPKALNALTLEMILSLQRQLLLWQKQDDIKAVVIQSVPGNAFCAGGDVRTLYQNRANPEQQMLFFWHEYRLNHLIHHLGKPYIALLDGITMGGGVGISLHGSHPIASEHFVFAMPETTIGFFPDIGASYLLARCPEHIGFYLGLTGHRLKAEEAHYSGLIKGVMVAKEMPLFLEALQNYAWSTNAYADVDDCLARFVTENPGHFAQSELIDECFSSDSIEDILATLLHHPDYWAKETAEQLIKKSPLSIKVTLAQLQKAQGLSLAQCLSMDYNLVSHFMKGADFYEGVRALLIDKDKNPQWHPSALEEVTQALVEQYFNAVASPLHFNEIN